MSERRVALGDADFGEDYFLHGGTGRPYRKDEHWLGFFTPIADLIATRIRPRRVLDAGCALGFLVELLRERGIDAYGFDLSSYAITHVPESVRPFCWRASVAEELSDTYDLIVCQEVFPHVLPEDADAAIGNFCRHTGDIVFSSMPVPDRSARRHVNFSTPGHYAAAFAGYGFYRDSSFDASVVTPWAVRFRRASPQETIGVYEDRLWSESAQRQELERRLTETESRVANMERSWFWRMRTPWAKITGR